MNGHQLSLIREFSAICTASSIEFWLRGGWAMDFFPGRITREHSDIDLFAWRKDVPTLMERLQRAGFEELGGAPAEAQRNLTRDGEELQIALLETNERGEVVVAGGPWAGAAWPDGMLIGPASRLGDLVCPIVNPQVQIEIKEKFGEWRPELPRREKHQADIDCLRAALSADAP
jgi:hypothetical protein